MSSPSATIDELPTLFAPAAVDSPDQIRRLSEEVSASPLFQAVLASVDGYLLVLNQRRQILAANRDFVQLLGLEPTACLIGDRLGDALRCIHASEGPGGCGTSEHCRMCGAVLAILGSQATGEPVTRECLASVNRDAGVEALELRVRATPIEVGGHSFTVLALHDISAEKRREALERTFFHDILNTVGGLTGWSKLLGSVSGLDPAMVASRILALARRLEAEIETHRGLTQAESGTLAVELSVIPVQQVLDVVSVVFEAHPVTAGKRFSVEAAEPDDALITDAGLLCRVLTNMVKNAFESSAPGTEVRLWYERRDAEHQFSVHNPGVIPRDVALRIFQRSFSTKAASGRGIGTYSMKLFGERYLGGHVGFTTSAASGTTFFIQLPTEVSPRELSSPPPGPE